MVIAINAEAGIVTKTTAGSGGVYVFTKLLSGVYEVVAEATGCKKLLRTGITWTSTHCLPKRTFICSTLWQARLPTGELKRVGRLPSGRKGPISSSSPGDEEP